jgi:hypothetical protein
MVLHRTLAFPKKKKTFGFGTAKHKEPMEVSNEIGGGSAAEMAALIVTTVVWWKGFVPLPGLYYGLVVLARSLESIRVLFSGGVIFILEALWIFLKNFDFKNGAFGPFYHRGTQSKP